MNKLKNIIKKIINEQKMNWDYFYIKNGKLVDEDGHVSFNNAPNFNSIDSAEQWLEKNNERGSVVGFWKDHVGVINQNKKFRR